MGIVGIDGVAMLGNRGEISRGGKLENDKNVVVVDLGRVRDGDQLHGVLCVV